MDYRAYLVGQEGHFVGVRDFEAPDDDTAIQEAKRFLDGLDMEVWHRGRRIAQIASKDGAVTRTAAKRWDIAPFECAKLNRFPTSAPLKFGGDSESSRGKIVAISLADKADEYIGFARHCLIIARSLPNRDDRVTHREMAAEWARLAQVITEDASRSSSEQVGKTRLKAVT